MVVASHHKVVVAKVKRRLKINQNTKSGRAKDLKFIKDPDCAKIICNHVTNQNNNGQRETLRKTIPSSVS